jgi:hypothetical protein
MTVALAADFTGQLDFDGGRYTAIPWHERFRTDHQWSGARVAWDRGQVEITFVKQGDGTRLSLVQKGFPSADVRDDFAGGWPGVFDALQGTFWPAWP